MTYKIKLNSTQLSTMPNERIIYKKKLNINCKQTQLKFTSLSLSLPLFFSHTNTFNDIFPGICIQISIGLSFQHSFDRCSEIVWNVYNTFRRFGVCRSAFILLVELQHLAFVATNKFEWISWLLSERRFNFRLKISTLRRRPRKQSTFPLISSKMGNWRCDCFVFLSCFTVIRITYVHKCVCLCMFMSMAFDGSLKFCFRFCCCCW